MKKTKPLSHHVRDYGQSFAVAVQFLTQIPIRFKHYPDHLGVGRSLMFYPLVGGLIGLLLLGVSVVLQMMQAPLGLSAAIVLSVWLWITGALHIDGLADSADAWLGGHGDKARTLAIMKDPASGPIAVVVIVCVLLLKWSALTTLLDTQSYSVLIVIPLLARTALIPLLLNTPYVRSGGIGEQLVRHAPVMACSIAVMLAMIFASISSGFSLVLLTVMALVVLRAVMLERLQGLTGDTAGASVEIIEVLLLVAIVICGNT